jgi:hypothetical protein
MKGELKESLPFGGQLSIVREISDADSTNADE